MTLVESSDNAGTNRWSALSFDTAGGVTYHFAIDGKDGDSGRILLYYNYEHVDPFFQAVRMTNGAVELVLMADDDKPFVIEASSNLTNWSPIASGRAVSAEASAEMIAILKRQKFNDGIPAGLPPGTPVAHKTGTITRIHHDAGVVYSARPYVLVILTRGIADQKISAKLMAGITSAIARATS